MADASKLVQSAMMLREIAPHQWENFLLSLREYSSALNVELVRAEPASLARAQGMAMAVQDLFAVLFKAPELFDKQRLLKQGRKDDHGRGNTWPA